ncbi:MAG: hypothetical protein IJ572_03310 [Bacilli bacterium]|nr:hypothetical protein [Bacilli bacterium]
MKNKLKNVFKNKFLGEVEPDGDKQKALILLIVGFTFLIVVFVVARININKPKEVTTKQERIINEEITYLPLNELFDKYKDNYNYNITILNNETNSYVYYIGSINDNINIGKKIDDALTINYQINNLGAINLDTNENITNLYDGYLYYFFNPYNLYDYIRYYKSEEKTLDSKKIYTYNNKYNDLDINIKITTGVDKIEEISYNYNNNTYNIVLS